MTKTNKLMKTIERALGARADDLTDELREAFPFTALDRHQLAEQSEFVAQLVADREKIEDAQSLVHAGYVVSIAHMFQLSFVDASLMQKRLTIVVDHNRGAIFQADQILALLPLKATDIEIRRMAIQNGVLNPGSTIYALHFQEPLDTARAVIAERL
jgi:hypothetical protein